MKLNCVFVEDRFLFQIPVSLEEASPFLPALVPTVSFRTGSSQSGSCSIIHWVHIHCTSRDPQGGRWNTQRDNKGEFNEYMVCRGVDGVGKQPKGGETPGGHCYHSGPGGASRGSVCSNPRRTVALGEGLLDRNCEHRERYTAPGKTAGRAGNQPLNSSPLTL